MKALSEIVAALVHGVRQGSTVSLNTIKREVRASPTRSAAVKMGPADAGLVQVSIKYSLAKAPKLVEIITAVPEEHRAALLPQ